MTDQHRLTVDQRPDRPADLICEAIGAAVSEALATGQFGDHLADRGWALVHVGDGGCPEPPAEWLHLGLDMTEPGWIDPVGRLAEMWQVAWEAGQLAERGRTGTT